MAGAGYKLFNTGDVLTAQQVNEYLMQQTVMVFADASARTTALSGVLAEGMLSYLKSDDKTYAYNGTSWVEVGGSLPSQTGNSGKYLTTDGTNPSWGTISAGGMTLITTTTFNNTANTYTYSSLGSYKHLMIVIDNLSRALSTSIDNIGMQFNSVTTADYDSKGWGVKGSTSEQQSYNASTQLIFGPRVVANSNATTAERGVVMGWIYDYAGSTRKVFTSITRCFNNGADVNYSYNAMGIWNDTAAITSFTIFTESASNFNTGTLKLYGVS